MDLQTITMSFQTVITGVIIVGLFCFIVGFVNGVRLARPHHGYHPGERM
jgi:hypothetical protein